jgi:hypothetical protein
MAFAGRKTIRFSKTKIIVLSDTMPDICVIIPPADIEALNIFKAGPITHHYPEPDPVEGFTACYYEFNSIPRRYAALGIQLIKMTTKEDANDVFRNWEEDYARVWLTKPERIPKTGDSCSIFSDPACTEDKCPECMLIVKQGVYVMFVSFKGPEDITQSGVKSAGLKIIQMLYNRIPWLKS